MAAVRSTMNFLIASLAYRASASAGCTCAPATAHAKMSTHKDKHTSLQASTGSVSSLNKLVYLEPPAQTGTNMRAIAGFWSNQLLIGDSTALRSAQKCQ